MTKAWATGVWVAGLLAGCSSSPAPEDASRPPPMRGPDSETCNAAPAQAHLGNTLSGALERNLLAASQARQVRVLRPGESYTMDFRADRLNIHLDEEGRIVELSCG